jgi:MFS family permease
MDFYRHLFLTDGNGKAISFAMIYLLSTIFAFQTLLTAYTSSTYIEQFIASKYVGLIYVIASIGAVVLAFVSNNILRAIGNVNFVLILMSAITILLLIIGFAFNPILTIIAFILFLTINPQIYFNIDIFLETLIGTDENSTGSKRGLILTVMSIASFFSPIAMSYIVGHENNLSAVYFVAAGIGLVFIMLIIARFRNFFDPTYIVIKPLDLIKKTHLNGDIKIVLYGQFLLQFFYTWAVIYIPLYLATEIGLDWDAIGKIIAVGLFAFVILEYPIGRLADKHIGEKEMMALGFVILSVGSAFISFFDTTNILNWMILAFITRIGASLVEVTTESYFFKQVKGDDSSLISTFRLTRPIANLFGALIGSLSLIFLPFNLIFVILGLILVTGVFVTTRLTDTK